MPLLPRGGEKKTPPLLQLGGPKNRKDRSGGGEPVTSEKIKIKNGRTSQLTKLWPKSPPGQKETQLLNPFGRDPYILHLNIALYMVGSLHFGGKTHVSNGQHVSF